MIYPEFLKESGTIGVTAPSDGSYDNLDIQKIERATNQLNIQGINIIETPNCRTANILRSSGANIRAQELESLFRNDKVDVIICLSGGEYLVEMLSYLNFNEIRKHPKWLQGFSDPTGLTYTITTNLDIATIYSYNFRKLAMRPLHKSIETNLEILKGNIVKQESFDMFEKNRPEKELEGGVFSLDSKVEWINLNR